MKQVGISYARTHMCRLVREAEHGEIVLLTRKGRPAGLLVPLDYSEADGAIDNATSIKATEQSSKQGAS
jgi:prevent-host-death family protein